MGKFVINVLENPRSIFVTNISSSIPQRRQARQQQNQQGNSTQFGSDVPDSCCTAGTNKDCGKDAIKSHQNNTIYEDGCLKTFEDLIEDNAYIVGGAGAGLGVLQILVLVGSFCLAKRDNYYA